MKQMNRITPPNNNEQHLARTRNILLVAAMAVGTSSCADMAQSARENSAAKHPTTTPSSHPTLSLSPSPSVSASTREPLPADWPDSATELGDQDCRWGAPITRQTPVQVGPYIAGIVDTRCEPPANQPYSNVHANPTRNSPITGRAYDAQVVRLDCQIAGQPLGDDRGPRDFKNPQWFSISYKNRDNGNAVAAGYIAGANLGQIDVPVGSAQVPPCR